MEHLGRDPFRVLLMPADPELKSFARRAGLIRLPSDRFDSCTPWLNTGAYDPRRIEVFRKKYAGLNFMPAALYNSIDVSGEPDFPGYRARQYSQGLVLCPPRLLPHEPDWVRLPSSKRSAPQGLTPGLAYARGAFSRRGPVSRKEAGYRSQPA